MTRFWPVRPRAALTGQSTKAQVAQFGYNCDYLALPWERHRQVLVANHEYTDENLMFAGYSAANPTKEQVAIAWAAHGLSVLVLDEAGAATSWRRCAQARAG